jgi:hypothetical protein
VACDFERNQVRYEGSALPSSESLTHAAIYESDANAGAIVHCHNSKLWAALLNQTPTTSKTAEYGTPEMAYEIMQLFTRTDAQSRKIVVMAGHEGSCDIKFFGRAVPYTQVTNPMPFGSTPIRPRSRSFRLYAFNSASPLNEALSPARGSHENFTYSLTAPAQEKARGCFSHLLHTHPVL